MAQNDLPDVFPEELAALEDLARLLEQYQTYLTAGHGFADSARVQAGNASGTARPALERLHPKGAAGLAQLETALRSLRADENPRTILEDLDPALKDLRALIATAKWRRRRPDPADSVAPATVTQPLPNPVTEPAATRPASPPPASDPPASRARAWLWVGGGLFVGLILGAFGTALPRSASTLSRVWVLLEPVIAAGSGGILGNLLFQSSDIKETVRRHWVTLLVCSVLLVSTVPTAVDSVKELLGMGATSAAPAQQSPPIGNSSAAGRPASAATTPSSPAAKPPSAPATSASAPPPAAVPSKATRGAPEGQTAECARLLQRVNLGELDMFTPGEKALLQRCK